MQLECVFQVRVRYVVCRSRAAYRVINLLRLSVSRSTVSNNLVKLCSTVLIFCVIKQELFFEMICSVQ